jgi:hypothetical protein
MESKPKTLLENGRGSALWAGTNRYLDAWPPDASHGTQPSVRKKGESAHAKHWGMVIDTRKLQHEEDMEPIIEACHKPSTTCPLENKNTRSSGSGKSITTMPSRTMPTPT